ncbi:MAG: hypothetical protein ACP5UB_10715 [Candidatus Sumerlaeaceae bacterium]
MNTRVTLIATLALALSATTFAGTFASIGVDGYADDWYGIAPLGTDAQDQSSGRDLKAIYVANDATNLYVRIESYNSVAFSGNDLIGIDGDNTSSTGYNLFASGIGSDLLVAGASMYGETTATFNNGSATPASVAAFYPWQAATNVEISIPLNTLIPGDISAAFPGGLGSTIQLVVGDSSNWDTVGAVTYTLEPDPGVPPFNAVLDNCDIFDSTANAQERTHPGTVDSGCSVVADSAIGVSGSPGDYAIKGTFTMGNTAWVTAQIARRISQAANISGAANVLVDVKGDPAATNQQIWLGLIDADGTYLATTDQAVPTSSGWTTVSFGNPASWYVQQAGSTPGLDLSHIVEWRLGLSNNGTGTGGTFNVSFDNIKVQKAGVSDWSLY